MQNNIPTYITPTIDSIFIAYIDCHILLQYQRILKYINNINDKNINNKSFLHLINKVHNSPSKEFNVECNYLVEKDKIHYCITEMLISLNNTINGNPNLSQQPFTHLNKGRLIKTPNQEQIIEYISEAQKLMKSRYHIMLQEFEKDNKIEQGFQRYDKYKKITRSRSS